MSDGTPAQIQEVHEQGGDDRAHLHIKPLHDYWTLMSISMFIAYAKDGSN
jgi:hypothetical protein